MNPQLQTASLMVEEVVNCLGEFSKMLGGKVNLTTLKAFHFVKTKVSELSAHYLGDRVRYSDEVGKQMEKNSNDIDMAVIVRSVKCLYALRFPNN